MHAMHETLEMLEITTFKTVALTKSKTMQALISDDGLKEILQRDVETSTRHLEELASLLSRNIDGVNP